MTICPLGNMHDVSSGYVCEGTEGGQELTQAIFNANTQTTESHIITFAQGIKNLTLTEEITIRSNITVNGNGAKISGNGTFRLFRVTSGHAAFNRITFTNGKATGNGGAVEVAGTDASASFANCTFALNQAAQSGGAVSITIGSVSSPTTFTHCSIAGNTADSGGGVSLATGAASAFGSIIIGNGSGDISGNVQLYETLTGQDFSVGQVLLTDNAGMVQLDSNNMLPLAPSSPAIDAISTRNSYTLDTDQLGTTRPQLYGYDLGAYEALPVSAEEVIVSGEHYIQVGRTEKFSVKVNPADASRNVRKYPPDAITWSTLNTAILSVDSDGTVSALNGGEGFVTAIFHGWDAQGNEQEKRSEPFYVRVGTEERQNPTITIDSIDDVILGRNEHRTITPQVTITANDYSYDPVAGVNYRINAEALSSGVISAVASGDSVIIMAMETPGSCDVRVTAETIPSGSNMSREFHVTVTEGEVGRSTGGGGCEVSMLGMAGMIMLLRLCYRGDKNETE